MSIRLSALVILRWAASVLAAISLPPDIPRCLIQETMLLPAPPTPITVTLGRAIRITASIFSDSIRSWLWSWKFDSILRSTISCCSRLLSPVKRKSISYIRVKEILVRDFLPLWLGFAKLPYRARGVWRRRYYRRREWRYSAANRQASLRNSESSPPGGEGASASRARRSRR